MRRVLLPALFTLAVTGCPKDNPPPPGNTGGQAKVDPGAKKDPEPKKDAKSKVVLITDVGGRGDQSFNDSALRGLELWASGVKYSPNGYQPLPDADFQASIPADLKAQNLAHLAAEPKVVQAKSVLAALLKDLVAPNPVAASPKVAASDV